MLNTFCNTNKMNDVAFHKMPLGNRLELSCRCKLDFSDAQVGEKTSHLRNCEDLTCVKRSLRNKFIMYYTLGSTS